MQKRIVLWAGMISLLWGSPSSPCGSKIVSVVTGSSIQRSVDSNPPETIFVLEAGTYALQTVIPKKGSVFIGEPGAVMNGAKRLTVLKREGKYWVASNQTQQGQVHGECMGLEDGKKYDGCKFPEDLFIDDVPLRQVTRKSELGKGKWFFDYAADKIYLSEDPADHKVETSVTRHAFWGSASDVVIRGLIIEKYANPAQHGAIHAREGTNGPSGKNWVIEDSEIRLNHGAGISVRGGARIRNNSVHHNGQLGIDGGGRIETDAQRYNVYNGDGDDIRIEGNKIYGNNTQGHSSGWAAGGVKVFNSRHLVVRNNYVYQNKGPGLWTDYNNIHTLYEGNVVVDNVGVGIFHEMSYDVVIRNNIVRRNGRGFDVGFWGSQILVANSRNAAIEGNVVEVASDAGDAIGLLQQNRGGAVIPERGEHLTVGNEVYNNKIVFRGGVGQHGVSGDYQKEKLYEGANRFDHNTYCVPRLGRAYWQWRGTRSWEGFRLSGQEKHGNLYLSNSLYRSNPEQCENMIKITERRTNICKRGIAKSCVTKGL